MEFPSPVGGVPFPSDYAPSILFAVMYGLLLPLLAYRILDRKSRNTLLIGTALFSIERIVIFSLRAIQSHNPEKRVSNGLTAYMQSTIGIGFIGIAQDLVNLQRVLLVNSTSGDSGDMPAPLHPESQIQVCKEDTQLRFRYRRFSDFLGLSFLAAILPGVVGNSNYGLALTNAAWATKVMQLRYASTSVALFLIIVMAGIAYYASGRISRHRQKAIRMMFVICILLIIPAIYRLIIMYHTTTSLISMSPSSLNTVTAKATFYIFHMIPEWMAVALLLGFNVREMFGTGAFGDWRGETPSQKERRKTKEAADKAGMELS